MRSLGDPQPWHVAHVAIRHQLVTRLEMLAKLVMCANENASWIGTLNGAILARS